MNDLQLKTPISDCNFSIRTKNLLKSVSIEYLEELSNMYNNNDLRKQSYRWKNFGRKSYTEVESVIRQKGLSGYDLLEPYLGDDYFNDKEEESITDGLFAIASAINNRKRK
tara:strand:- start:66 stop:398 length:333 start_codon:yes stop_codon:yes gene_type:complete